MVLVTDVELNYLVFRYLHESGFLHAGFAFGFEAGLDKCKINGDLIPNGALIKIFQKGLQYIEMEANLSNAEGDTDEDFSFLTPLDLITKDVNELIEMFRERRKERDKVKERGTSKESDNGLRSQLRGKFMDMNEKQKEQERKRERMVQEKKREREKIELERVESEREKIELEKERQRVETERRKIEIQKEWEREKELKREREKMKQLGDVAAEPMEVTMASASQPCHFRISDVRILEGHTSEVCVCSWSPSASLLASGSGDGTARIWSIPEGPFNSDTSRCINALVLQHSREENKDVTTFDWNGEGTLLASGSCDSQVRIWNTSGELKSILRKHIGPIFALKWNKKGNYLLSGSYDETAVVWDVKAERWKQQFRSHKGGATLDVDWLNNVSFVTSSADKMIYFWKIGDYNPVKAFTGHKGEVNCVRWDPTGSLLASCSDDSTVKIWKLKQQTYLHDLRDHTEGIYSIRWSPTGPGTNNPNKQLILASASVDSTVKLWDVEVGKTIYSLNGHSKAVYTVEFSPNGEYIASGSSDKSLHIWSVKQGKIVKTYTGKGCIYDVSWNKQGNKIACASVDNSVRVLDFRM